MVAEGGSIVHHNFNRNAFTKHRKKGALKSPEIQTADEHERTSG